MDVPSSAGPNNFLDLFYCEIDSLAIDNGNTTLNLHILQIENNAFKYDALLEQLSDMIIYYALNKQELLALKDTAGGSKYRKAVARLRSFKSNDGELGEVLLYCFLECHLKAPKILTKMALKTNSEHYINGSDGVHILKVKDNSYHLIFGESKLNDDISSGISDAFESINNFITRRTDNLNNEVQLVSTHLREETIDEDLYQYIKGIILPSANGVNSKNNAFGIFIGFNIDFTDEEKGLKNELFTEQIRKKILEQVKSKTEYIKSKVEKYNLQGYTFYIYVIPFTEIRSRRKKFIEDLQRIK